MSCTDHDISERERSSFWNQMSSNTAGVLSTIHVSSQPAASIMIDGENSGSTSVHIHRWQQAAVPLLLPLPY